MAERLWDALHRARTSETEQSTADLEDAAFRYYLPMARSLAHSVCGASTDRVTAEQAAELGLAHAVLAWRPVSVYTAMSRIVDLLHGPDAAQGAVSPDAHPDCCISSPLLVNRRTAQAVPLFSFFDAEQFAKDATVITDSARGPLLTKLQLALAVARNIRPRELPSSVHAKDVVEIVRQGLSCLDSSRSDWHRVTRKEIKWTWITVQGMWFQDLFNYDSSNAQASATPVATPDGEIDFSAYNGAGWRQIVEHYYHPVSLAAWHHNHGRHKIFAQGKLIPVEMLSAAEPHHNSSEPVAEISL